MLRSIPLYLMCIPRVSFSTSGKIACPPSKFIWWPVTMVNHFSSSVDLYVEPTKSCCPVKVNFSSISIFSFINFKPTDSSMNKMRRMSTLLALMVTICISVDAKNSANATLKTPPRASDPTFLGVWADSAYPGILTTGTTLMILCYLTYVVFYGNHSFITTRVGKMNLYQILFLI